MWGGFQRANSPSAREGTRRVREGAFQKTRCLAQPPSRPSDVLPPRGEFAPFPVGPWFSPRWGATSARGGVTVLSRTPADGNRRSAGRCNRSSTHSTTRNQTRNRCRSGTPTRKTLCFHRLFHGLQECSLSLYTNNMWLRHPLSFRLVSLLWPQIPVLRCIMRCLIPNHN